MRAAGRAALVAAVVLAALTGCTSDPVAEHSAPPSSRPSPTATPASTPTTPPPTQVPADATPVKKRCTKLVPSSVQATVVAGLKREPGWTPAADSSAGRLSALSGTACRWTDAAGDLLEVAVAKPSSTDATALKNDLVERSQSVPTFGGEAYFQVVDHVGEADVFRGRTWLLARSNRFYEPGDAQEVVAAALKAMGYGPAPSPTPTPGASGPTPTATGTPAT